MFSQDSNNLRDALKYSAQMLSELRTSKLSPQKYYQLCKCLPYDLLCRSLGSRNFRSVFYCNWKRDF